MLWGAIVAALFKSDVTNCAAVLSVNIIFQFTCSLLWPIEGVPKIIRSFFNFLPLTRPIAASRLLMQNSVVNFWQPKVLSGFVTLFGWSFGAVAIIGLLSVLLIN
jgi:hypothetical protein